MYGIRFALVTFFLFGAATAGAHDADVITLQAEPIDLNFDEIKDGGVNKVLPKSYHELHYGETDHEVELQGAPIDFDFEDVIPMNMQKSAPQTFEEEFQKRDAEAETVELQEQAIPFDLDFDILNKREVHEYVPEEVGSTRFSKRATEGETVLLQEQAIPIDLDFELREKRVLGGERVELQEQSIPFDMEFQFLQDKREVHGYVPEEVGSSRFSKRGNYNPWQG